MQIVAISGKINTSSECKWPESLTYYNANEQGLNALTVHIAKSFFWSTCAGFQLYIYHTTGNGWLEKREILLS